MSETNDSGDVDKMVSEFLAELNALSNSLGVAAEKPSPDKAEQSGGVPQPMPEGVVPEIPAVRALEQIPTEPPKESGTEQLPPAFNTAHYRNIDILLMDNVQSTPLRKKADEYEFPHNYRAMYRSRFWLFKHPRVLVWAAASVALVCLLGALYLLDPFGRLTPDPPAAGSAPAPISITPAMAMDKIVPSYPAKARKLGIRGVVELEVDVDEQGKVVRATAVSGPALLRSAAAQAIKKCRFKPANRDGVNLKSTIRISVPFNP